MKAISAALKAHLAQDATTLCTCWRVTQVGGTPFGFTDHDADLLFEGLTYQASTGFTASAVATSATFDVDNMEVDGALESPAITEADMLAGRWDYAAIEIFLVNWTDLTQGRLIQKTGRLGQVSTVRRTFRAELLGKSQAFKTNIGEMYQPGCRATFGDARCTKPLGPLTVTGTITQVLDARTFTDSSRGEAGPPGAKTITGITQAAPAVITCTAHGFATGTSVTLAGISGMTELNGLIVIVTSTGADTFSIGIDTTAQPAYASGGTATPVGSGYFDGGLITFTNGANAGRSFEVKSFLTGGTIILQDIPFDSLAVGNAYSLIPGCDKSASTCKNRWGNLVNVRGEPHLPGLDVITRSAA